MIDNMPHIWEPEQAAFAGSGRHCVQYVLKASCVKITLHHTRCVFLRVLLMFVFGFHQSASHQMHVPTCSLHVFPQDIALWHLQSRYYRVCWCVRSLSGLAAASLKEDTYGVAQLSRPNLGDVVVCLLGVVKVLEQHIKCSVRGDAPIVAVMIYCATVKYSAPVFA